MLKNRGFSLDEIKKAELSVAQVKKANIMVDLRRKTMHEENVKLLQTLVKRTEKGAEGKEKVALEDLAIQSLDNLEGLSKKLKQKLFDLGVETPADFLAEDDEDLMVFLNVEEKEIKEWKKQIQGK